MRVFDNGGKSFDRYRVTWADEDPSEEWDLVIGPTGNAPNGVCIYIETLGPNPTQTEIKVSFMSIPAPVANAIYKECRND